MDTYTLSVSADGRLGATLQSSKTDQRTQADKDAMTDWDGLLTTDEKDEFNSGLNSITKDISAMCDDFASAGFETRLLAAPQSFVFPGGKVFAYKAASFSEHQDLVCTITYLDPNSVMS